MSEHLPPSGPPPSQPPPSGPPPSRPATPQARRGPILAAAGVGLLVGIGATAGVLALTGGDGDGGDDVDLACAALAGVPDDVEDDVSVTNGGVDRLLGVSSLLVAAAGGEEDTETYRLGNEIRVAIARADSEGLAQGVEEARDLC